MNNEELIQKVDKEVLEILKSYNDKKIMSSHNFNLLKRQILSEKYGIEWDVTKNENIIRD